MLAIALLKVDDITTAEHELLSALPFGKDELLRLKKINNPARRKESLVSLYALSLLCRKYISDENATLTLIRKEGGKPCFASLPMHLSLSHSKGYAVAVLCDTPVGVDIEWARRPQYIDRIARRYFTKKELALLDSHRSAPDEISAAFLSAWTKKEAYAKLGGEGFISTHSEDIPQNIAFFQWKLLHKKMNLGFLSLCLENAKNIKAAPKIDSLETDKELEIYEI